MHINGIDPSTIDQEHPESASTGELRQLRTAAGLSQQSLAERANCSISTVALLERGYVPKRSATLTRLLAVLGSENEP
jgi:transcriptional regulator with XRE-family HTH domain